VSGPWLQQGLNDRSGMARRYHWHSASVKNFVANPHTAIVGEQQGIIVNLVDVQARSAQTAMLNIVREHPEKTLAATRHLRMPAHHDVRATNVDLKRLGAVLAVAYERDLHDFAELLLLEKLGPRTLQSLAWWLKSCMAHRAVSTIRLVSLSRLAAKIVTRFRSL